MPGKVPFSVSRSIRSATSRLKSGSMKSSERRLASFCRISRVTGKCVIGRTLTAHGDDEEVDAFFDETSEGADLLAHHAERRGDVLVRRERRRRIRRHAAGIA